MQQMSENNAREGKMRYKLKSYLLGDFRHDEFLKTEKILFNMNRNIRVLDVGCGYGKKIKLLQKLGFRNITGVEINEEIVRQNVANGLNVISVNDFNKNDELFDLIIMSHVIEHFQYQDLKLFMEKYLKSLKNDGYLLILTPMLDKTFYTNFDHVKPYLPDGIRAVFEDENAQVQFYSTQKLELIDIEFRKTPFNLKYYKSNYVGKQNIFLKFLNLTLLLLFNLTYRVFGRTNGWIGLYKKC